MARHKRQKHEDGRALWLRLAALASAGVLAWSGAAGLVALEADAAPLPPECVASGPSGATVTCTYTEIGEHVFTVPAGVTTVDLSAIGARGGGAHGGGDGGLGGTASLRYPVAAGDHLYAEVGGMGGYGTAGANGGGRGGVIIEHHVPTSSFTAGGGGASDVRRQPSTDPATLWSRVLVAAGGGGGGEFGVTGGGPGEAGEVDIGRSYEAAGGGATTGGGAAGTTCACPGTNAQAGSFGRGGDGNSAEFSNTGEGYGGAGGGGGYYGGGGATGLRAGGGGGSNYAPGGSTGVNTANLPPQVVITYTRMPSGPMYLYTSGPSVIGAYVPVTAKIRYQGPVPTGSIRFRAFGPDDPACSGAAAFEETAPLYDEFIDVFAQSGFVPSTAGTYYWQVSYSGDSTYAPAELPCGSETSVVAKRASSVSGSATPLAAAGGMARDAASVTGYRPTGSVTFDLFGPADPICAGAPFATVTKALDASGNVSSGPVTVGGVGAYRWRVSYSGDVNNDPSASPCTGPNAVTQVVKATPVLSTQASNGSANGFTSTVHDDATLSGGFQPGGTLSFEMFPPSDPMCTGSPVVSGGQAVTGNGTYSSGGYPVAAAGDYHWKVTYSGDANNATVVEPCGRANETSTVAKGTPTLTTVPTDGSAGGTVSDSATVSGGYQPTGTVTFALFGVDDPTCRAHAIASVSHPVVVGQSTYGSGALPVGGAGAYHWTVSYSGDANNAAFIDTCAEVSTVAPVAAAVTGQASGSVPVGGTVSDTATVTGYQPIGTVTFTLYGPDDTSCSGTPVATSTATLDATGAATSDRFVTTAAGTYRFIAAYSGDPNNKAASTDCAAAEQAVTVTALPTPAPDPSVPPTHAPPAAPKAPAAPAAVPLAATGTPVGHLLTLGGEALLAGVALIWAARRRRTRPHH